MAKHPRVTTCVLWFYANVFIDFQVSNKTASSTIPWPLNIQQNIKGNTGVFTKADLPTRLLLGPYEGEIILDAAEDDQNIVGWKVFF